MTLNLRCLVPIASGVLLSVLSSYEDPQLSHSLRKGVGSDWNNKAIRGKMAIAQAGTMPDPSALYNAAVALGGDAQHSADRARVPQDWERAAMGWERALNFLKAIPPGSPMYQAAQAKIIDYEKRLDRALGRIRRADGLSSLQALT